MEGRRHNYTFYFRSGPERQLPSLLNVDSMRFCLSGDSGYSRRRFMEITYEGSNFVVQYSSRAFRTLCLLSGGRLVARYMRSVTTRTRGVDRA